MESIGISEIASLHPFSSANTLEHVWREDYCRTGSKCVVYVGKSGQSTNPIIANVDPVPYMCIYAHVYVCESINCERRKNSINRYSQLKPVLLYFTFVCSTHLCDVGGVSLSKSGIVPTGRAFPLHKPGANTDYISPGDVNLHLLPSNSQANDQYVVHATFRPDKAGELFTKLLVSCR